MMPASFCPIICPRRYFQQSRSRRSIRKAWGQLVDMGIRRGRATRPDLKVGICGEHGGDPKSVEFCHEVKMNYVSCSPYRVPIARLAAAQAAVK